LLDSLLQEIILRAMAMSSVTFDLASLLSQYRVMAYHNLETGKDEGLVFVKKGEDQSTGKLIRWTGGDNNPPETGTPSIASSSTSTPPASSPCSRPVSECAGTTPSTSQRQYSNPLNNNEYASVDNYKGTLRNRSNIILKDSRGNTSNNVLLDTIKNICSFEQKDSEESRINVEKEDSLESSLNVEEKEDSVGSRSNDRHMDPVRSSDDVKQIKSVGIRRNDAGMKDIVNNRSYEERKTRLEMYKMAGEAGWVREVVKGDRKGHTEKMRITYLPPRHLRNIKNRLYNTVQLDVFLTTHCPDTSLSQDNFSFSAKVLGLDMPWEVVRQASISRGVFPTKKLGRSIFSTRRAGPTSKKARPGPAQAHAHSPTHKAAPTVPTILLAQMARPANSPTEEAVVATALAAPCLHCLQPLPLSEGAAALHVRRCLHSKNARLRAVLEGADYSPLQHATPVQYKQRMPGKEVNQGQKMKIVPQPQARASLSLDSLPDCISVSKLSL